VPDPGAQAIVAIWQKAYHHDLLFTSTKPAATPCAAAKNRNSIGTDIATVKFPFNRMVLLLHSMDGTDFLLLLPAGKSTAGLEILSANRLHCNYIIYVCVRSP